MHATISFIPVHLLNVYVSEHLRLRFAHSMTHFEGLSTTLLRLWCLEKLRRFRAKFFHFDHQRAVAEKFIQLYSPCWDSVPMVGSHGLLSCVPPHWNPSTVQSVYSTCAWNKLNQTPRNLGVFRFKKHVHISPSFGDKSLKRIPSNWKNISENPEHLERTKNQEVCTY